MMILGKFKFCAIGALLAVLAAPTPAATPEGRAAADPRTEASAGRQSADASRSRRVELPFPLDLRAPDRVPRENAPQDDAGPHPFRETPFKRASLENPPSGPAANFGRRLSRFPDFS